MTITIKHAKTVTIPDPTQAELDAQIALGNYPVGTVLADIALQTDWNNDHTIDTTGANDGDVLTVIGGQAEWATLGGSGNPYSSDLATITYFGGL